MSDQRVTAGAVQMTASIPHPPAPIAEAHDAATIIAALILNAQQRRSDFLADANVENVHALRRALRRLRALLRVLDSLSPAEDRAWIDGELKWLTRRLGLTRDLDVLQARLVPRLHYAPQTLAEEVLLASAMRKRADAATIATRDVASARAGLLLAGLAGWLQSRAEILTDPSQLSATVSLKLERLDARIRADARHAGALRRGARHRLRSKVKQLKYALEAMPWLNIGADYPAALADLQAILGDMNDDAVGARLVQSMQPSSSTAPGYDCRLAPAAEEKRRLVEACARFCRLAPLWVSNPFGECSSDPRPTGV